MAVATEVTGDAAVRQPGPLRRVAVTGATGFVGRALCRRLLASGVGVRALVRNGHSKVSEGCDVHVVGDLRAGPVDWDAAVNGTDTVFHLAGVANSSIEALWSVNVRSTESLARAAFQRGCRLVHVSTIKVFGDSSTTPLSERDVPLPSDEYGRTKLEAERMLARVGKELGGAWLALRPPIVFGPNEHGNFARLVRLACAGYPLPFASVDNRRSMIHVDVLVDALLRAATVDAAPCRCFVVSGGPALSTPQWLRLIAGAAGRPIRLWPLPPDWMLAGAALVGAGSVGIRLLRSLEVDDEQWRGFARWQPPMVQAEAVGAAVRATLGLE